MQLPGLVILLDGIATVAVWVCVPFLVVAYGSLQVSYDLTAPGVMFNELFADFQRTTWKQQNLFEALMRLVAMALVAEARGQDLTVVGELTIACGIVTSLFCVLYLENAGDAIAKVCDRFSQHGYLICSQLARSQFSKSREFSQLPITN